MHTLLNNTSKKPTLNPKILKSLQLINQNINIKSMLLSLWAIDRLSDYLAPNLSELANKTIYHYKCKESFWVNIGFLGVGRIDGIFVG